MKFGQYFRHLTILCRNERRKDHKFAHKQITQFFHLMEQEGVQLDGIRMPRLKVLSKLNVNQPTTISEKMINFLRMQTNLTEVNFNYGSSHTSPCLTILENLRAEKVEHLKLQKFFHYPKDLARPTYIERYVAAITRFHCLRSLWINYRYLTIGEVMPNLAANLEGHLEVLGILMHKCISIDQGISENNWITLKAKCPKLEVHIRMEIHHMLTERMFRARFLSPQIPLVSMHFILDHNYLDTYDSFVFGALRQNYAETLRDATFELRGISHLMLRMEIIRLVHDCTRLENLTLRLRFTSFNIQEFYDDFLRSLPEVDEPKTSLKELRLTFKTLNYQLRGTRKYLQSTYVPIFRAHGIKLKMMMKK